jgi:hypothetical protein
MIYLTFITVRVIPDGFVKSPDAALRFIISHCGVRKVRLIPHGLRALPAALFTKLSYLASFSTFYDFIIPETTFFCESHLPIQGGCL